MVFKKLIIDVFEGKYFNIFFLLFKYIFFMILVVICSICIKYKFENLFCNIISFLVVYRGDKFLKKIR